MQELSIGYPSGLPYQILAPDAQPSGSSNPFELNTTTVKSVSGTTVSTVLGAVALNAWTVLTCTAAVSQSGAQTFYRNGCAEIKIVCDGTTPSIVAIATVGTDSNSFSGDAGKMTVTVAAVGGQVVLSFAPIGDATLTIYYGVTGTIGNAKGT